MNYLDRNEFNYAPSQEVVEALKNFDINKLCFYTRIYDEGKKSILSVYLSESYGIDEPQVLLGYGGEDILKQAVHYFLTQEDGTRRCSFLNSRGGTINPLLMKWTGIRCSIHCMRMAIPLNMISLP